MSVAFTASGYGLTVVLQTLQRTGAVHPKFESLRAKLLSGEPLPHDAGAYDLL